MDKKPAHLESVTVSYLRGLAALGVVMLHVRIFLWAGWNDVHADKSVGIWDKMCSWLSIPTPFGGIGVTLFFLLSGFCIALPYTKSAGRKLHFKEYFLRRFLRIYPPYFVAILLTALVELILAWEGLNHMTSANTYVSTLLMVQNYTTGSISSNGSLWSLPIEMELYLVFPIVYYLLRTHTVKALLIVTAVVSFAAFTAYMLGAVWLGENFAKYWLLWCSGAVLADYYAAGRLRKPPLSVKAVGLLALIVALGGQMHQWVPGLLDFIYGIFFVVLLWLGLTTEVNWSKRINGVGAKFLSTLGLISYSLYLIHYPFFKLCGALWVRYFGSKPINFLIPVCFALLAIPLAYLFYTLVEVPSHRWAKGVTKRTNAKQLRP